MTSFESESARIINKFNGGKFNILKFEIKMLLASMDLWNIMDRFEQPPPSNVDPKVLKEYQRCVKKFMSIIGLNLVENHVAHIKHCKRSV